MNKWQTIHKDRNIIAIVVLCTFSSTNNILIDDLKKVVMNILLINKSDIFRASIITLQHLNIIFLNLTGLFYDSFIPVGDGIFEKSIPFRFREMVTIQFLKLSTKIGKQIFFMMYCKIFVSLFREHTNKFFFQSCFRLIIAGACFYRLIFCNNCVLICFGYDIKIRHIHHLFRIYFVIGSRILFRGKWSSLSL